MSSSEEWSQTHSRDSSTASEDDHRAHQCVLCSRDFLSSNNSMCPRNSSVVRNGMHVEESFGEQCVFCGKTFFPFREKKRHCRKNNTGASSHGHFSAQSYTAECGDAQFEFELAVQGDDVQAADNLLATGLFDVKATLLFSSNISSKGCSQYLSGPRSSFSVVQLFAGSFCHLAILSASLEVLSLLREAGADVEMAGEWVVVQNGYVVAAYTGTCDDLSDCLAAVEQDEYRWESAVSHALIVPVPYREQTQYDTSSTASRSNARSSSGNSDASDQEDIAIARPKATEGRTMATTEVKTKHAHRGSLSPESALEPLEAWQAPNWARVGTAVIEPEFSFPVPSMSESLDDYDISSSPRGLGVIIANALYDDPKWDLDAPPCDALLMSLALKALGFVVETHSNVTARNLIRIARRYASLDHSAYTAFVFVYTGHGLSNMVVGCDGRGAPLEEVIGPYKRCASLKGKPKAFFFNSCRGVGVDFGFESGRERMPMGEAMSWEARRHVGSESDDEDDGWQGELAGLISPVNRPLARRGSLPRVSRRLSSSPGGFSPLPTQTCEGLAWESPKKDKWQREKAHDEEDTEEFDDIPIESDFLIGFATAVGYVSWADGPKGCSIWLWCLAWRLLNNSSKDHVVDVLTAVNNTTASYAVDGARESPNFISHLTKRLYLLPVLPS